MNKYIILSVNHNVDYMYFLPLTVWSWQRIGFEPIIFYRGDPGELPKLCFNGLRLLRNGTGIKTIDSIEGVKDATIAQVSRLYAGCVSTLEDDDYLMLGDVDMLALGSHWNGDTSKVTVYNHDLTGFGEIPMCYVGAPKHLWKQIMRLDGITYNEAIKRDIENYPNAKDPDFYKWWGCDQQILTARLKEYGTGKIDFINRGQYTNGFARGRVDRGAWSLNHDVFIDAHLMQQTHHSVEKIEKLFELLHKVWPGEDFTWFMDYTKEFKRLAV